MVFGYTKQTVAAEAPQEENVSISSKVVETIIGAQTKFKGSVTTDKPIRIDGVFEGDITSTDVVYVSECGSFKGNVSCRELQMVGKGEGKAVCEDFFEFASTGSFKGELIAKNLVMGRGSVLEGTCKIG
jgi:cytoskeletal protein CcmA (bactofilin family)